VQKVLHQVVQKVLHASILHGLPLLVQNSACVQPHPAIV
jgi:hypothetical protein